MGFLCTAHLALFAEAPAVMFWTHSMVPSTTLANEIEFPLVSLSGLIREQFVTIAEAQRSITDVSPSE